MSGKTVGIIGAGVSGLAATKIALVENGLRPTCFEQRDDIGGIWHMQNPFPSNVDIAARAYSGMILNVVKRFNAYSDFPQNEDEPFLQPGSRMKVYLDRYAEAYSLRQHIRLNRSVVGLRKADDYDTTGRWTITTVNALHKGDEESETFDSVIICSGNFSKGNWPSIPDQSNFSGTIIHSGQYWDTQPYMNRIVTIVGAGVSGVDLASHLAPVAKQVYLVTRQGVHLLPMFVEPGKSYEELLLNYRLQKPGSLPKVRNAFKKAITRRYDQNSLGTTCERPLLSFGSTALTSDIDQWIYSGRIKVVRGSVVRFTEEGIVMEDGATVETDDVIYATGYTQHCPFIRDTDLFPEQGSEQRWWQHVYPVQQAHPSLFTVGLIYGYGALTLTTEMQSRAVCGIISGELSLPDKEVMESEISAEKEATLTAQGTFPGYISQFPYTMGMAKFIGCYPKLWDIFKKSPTLAYKLWSDCLLGPYFRLLGPHSDWKAAKAMILSNKRNRFKASEMKKEKKHEKQKLEKIQPKEKGNGDNAANADARAKDPEMKAPAESEEDCQDESELKGKEAQEQTCNREGEHDQDGIHVIPDPTPNGHQSSYENPVCETDQ